MVMAPAHIVAALLAVGAHGRGFGAHGRGLGAYGRGLAHMVAAFAHMVGSSAVKVCRTWIGDKLMLQNEFLVGKIGLERYGGERASQSVGSSA